MRSIAYTTIAAFILLQEVTSFGIVVPIVSITRKGTHGALRMTSRDEYLQPHFRAPIKPSISKSSMSQIVECAQGSGQCSVEEMTVMIEDLERMNNSCKGENSNVHDCNLDSMDAREAIKHALHTQIELSQARNEMKNMDIIQGWKSQSSNNGATTLSSVKEDHSYDHFVDYRAIGEYESH